jgi:peroxiredoxin
MTGSFPAPPDDGAADHLRPGLALPKVNLPVTDGAEICLATLPGCSLLIIYPWTGRPGLPNPPDWDTIPGAHGSTPELEGFRDAAPNFARQGIRLFGLSRQTTDYQRELVDRLKLPFPLLSDAEGRFATALQLPSFTTGGKVYLKRLTLLVTAGGIAACFYPVRAPAVHAGEVLQEVRGSNADRAR